MRTARGASRSASSMNSGTWSRRSTARASKSSSTSSSITPPKAAQDGPTLCYRGLANDFYYILETDKSRYADYTGCGNTLNANQPIVRRLIQDSLRYWVTQMHVDGFRFDLASILSRDEAGRPLPNPPVLWDIESDPLLAGTKLIAEAWDAARALSGGQLRRRRVAGVERPVPRRCAEVSEGRQRLGVARWRSGSWAVRTSTVTRNARPSRASISSPVTTASRSTISSRTTTSTTRPTARTIATARTTIVSWNCGVGRADRRSGDRGAAQPAGQELLRAGAAGGRHADAAHGRRGAPDPAGQQQRLLPGQRDQLVRLEPAGAARRHPPVREDRSTRSASAAMSWRKTPRSPSISSCSGRESSGTA